jgi:dihydroorotase/N-acyl-D-amino-acid deacylase
MIAAPGFIDIHSRGRRGILQVPTAENYLREGVTTIIEGPDGSSPLPLAPFFDQLSHTPISINFGAMVGQGTIRHESRHRDLRPRQSSGPLAIRQPAPILNRLS